MHDRFLRLVGAEYTRRAVLKGGAGAVAALGGVLFGAGFRFANEVLAANAGDVDVLNFALGLEHVENALYQKANMSGKLGGMAADMLRTWGGYEQAHVDALTKAIRDAGGSPVAPGMYTFPSGMLDTQDGILQFVSTLEETVVGAYTGVANKLEDKGLLALAASIVQVEERLRALARSLLGDKHPIPSPLSAVFTADEVGARIKPLVAP
jgi:hypothetical protein